MRILLLAFTLLSCNLMLNAQKEHPIDKQLHACLDIDENQTTLGMMNCEGEAQKAWDKELNQNYKELMGLLKGEEKSMLKAAQRQWIKYRDLEFEFSGNMHYNMEGTMYRVFAAGRQTEFIKTRALELAQYIETLEMK